MAKRTDVGGGRGTATPNLDPSHELPANTGTSTLGTSSTGTTGASTGASGVTGADSNLGSGTLGSNTGSFGNTGSLGNTGGSLGNTGGSLGTTGSLGNTGSGLNTAGTSGQNLGDQGNQGVAQQAKDQAKNLANEAKDQTVKVAEQARDHVQQLVGQQKDQAAERLGSLAGALREAGRKLNEGEQAGDFGQYADRAAQQVERLSNYLRDSDLSGFVRDTENFARRRPEVFLGGALLAGLALARFLKASSPNRGFDGYEGGNWTGYGQAYSGRSPYASTGTTGAGRSSYTPERRNPDEATTADAGTTPYNAPLGV